MVPVRVLVWTGDQFTKSVEVEMTYFCPATRWPANAKVFVAHIDAGEDRRRRRRDAPGGMTKSVML